MNRVNKMKLRDINRYMNSICSLKSPDKEYISSTQVLYVLQNKYKNNKNYKKSEDIFHSLEVLQSMGYIRLKKNHSNYPIIEVTDSGMVFREQMTESKINWIVTNSLSIIAIIISIVSLFS